MVETVNFPKDDVVIDNADRMSTSSNKEGGSSDAKLAANDGPGPTKKQKTGDNGKSTSSSSTNVGAVSTASN